MRFHVVEVATSAVSTDSAHPELQGDYIYDHLKYYCSKFSPLPALTLVVAANRLVVTRNHVYWRIATDFGRELVRAVMSSRDLALQRQLAIPGVSGEVPPSVTEAESRREVINGWHVFFFESPPTREVREEVRRRCDRFLRDTAMERQGSIHPPCSILRFVGDGRCLEMEFNTPVHECATDFFSLWCGFFRSISRDLSPILSYQGFVFEK